ncbi:MAG: hypothetical protein M4D80_41585 [Myxococcota bacterium]|nr:hypothetical protein [Myxococcota bacterium]
MTVSRDVVEDGCSTVRAQVALDTTGGIAVAVRGASRGSEGRVVSDAALAAAWIDSWTRQDVDLWAAPPPQRVASIQPLVPPSDVEPSRIDGVAATSAGWNRFAVSASYAQTWSDDEATWQGLDVAACVRVVGGFCVGGSVRAAFDKERLFNGTGVARNELSVLALARYPVAIGRMSIAPELGVGVGRLATRRAESECKMLMPPNCSPMDPMCMPQAGMCDPTDPGTATAPKYYVGDGFSIATYAPRIALALRIAVPLFEHVWLDGSAGYTYAPFAHGSSFESPNDAGIAPELVALPGEPSGGYAIGVGLRVGAK